MNPAAPWQLAVYVAHVNTYAAVNESFRQSAAEPREKVEPEFQNSMATSKDFEMRGVACNPKEIWYNICVTVCVLSKNPSKLTD